MKSYVFIFLIILTASFCLPSCSEKQKTDEIPVDSDSTGGYIQEIQALGYPFAGEMNTEWRKYETIKFDSAGREIEHENHWEASTNKVFTTYDAQGRKIKVARTSDDRVGNVDYNFKWSADGLTCVEEEFVYKEGKVLNRITTRRNAEGKLVEMIQENLQFPEVGIDTLKQTSTYDVNGFLVLEEDFHQGKKIPSVRYYNASTGNPIRLERFDSEGNISRTEYYEYDDQGRAIVMRAMDQGQLEPSLVWRKKWNDAGLLMEEHKYTGICTAAGEQGGKCRIFESTRYTYDAEGRPLTKDTFNEGNEKPTMQLRYSYLPFKR